VRDELYSTGKATAAVSAVLCQLALPHVDATPDEPAAPIVKWAGGKTRLLPELLRRLPPEGFGRYIEPFAGGAALFLALRPRRAILADTNPTLIETYRVVQCGPAPLLTVLQDHASAHSTAHYYACRERFNARMDGELERAALLIYLNKTCFNGLFRVNKRGEFNVPCGRQARPAICEESTLARAHEALQRVELRNEPFTTLLSYARRGDLIFLDPPYVPVSKTASFTAYDVGGFDERAQRKLRKVFGALDRRGCRLMLTNSDAEAVRQLYRGYHIDVVTTRRSISCRQRELVNELIVRNYDDSQRRSA